MKWFFRWLREGINDLDRYDRDREEAQIGQIAKSLNSVKVRPARLTAGHQSEGHISFNQQPLHFKIYPATGGHIVEYTYYNEKSDRHDQALHLIPSDLDMATELSKIMTLEALKR